MYDFSNRDCDLVFILKHLLNKCSHFFKQVEQDWAKDFFGENHLQRENPTFRLFKQA